MALVLLAIVLAVNTIVTDDETKKAEADIGRILHLQGGDLQVREDGSRADPALVLLHGFASSMHWWTPAARRLAPNFHVIRIDLLGHGGSAKPKDGYSMENQARLVERALAALHVEHAVIAGHSMGGVVATALAELDPSLIDGIVTLGTPANESAGKLPFLARLGFVPVLGEAIRRVVTDSMVRDNLQKAFTPGFDVPDQFVRDFHRMTYSSYDSSHQESDEFGDEKDVADRLAAVRKPLLVIQGADDELVDPDSAQDYRRVPGATLVTMPSTGHTPMVEHPDQTAALITRFARRVTRKRAGRVR
jgi:pimeloyl-ACP methyl ester carboxylesterase